MVQTVILGFGMFYVFVFKWWIDHKKSPRFDGPEGAAMPSFLPDPTDRG